MRVEIGGKNNEEICGKEGRGSGPMCVGEGEDDKHVSLFAQQMICFNRPPCERHVVVHAGKDIQYIIITRKRQLSNHPCRERHGANFEKKIR